MSDLERFKSNKARPRRRIDQDGREYMYSPSAGRYIEVVAAQESVTKPTKKKRKSPFIMVPRGWAEKLAASRSANAYRLAHYLLDEHFKNGGEPIRVSNIGALNGAAIGRYAKWRALRELEALGLIRLEQHHGKSPLVTLNEV
jgi:hypothetical protein